MLIPEGIYRRIPLFWLLLGVLFLFLGLFGGSDLPYFFAYIGLAILGIGRGIWVYQARWKFHKRNEMAITRETVVIRHPIAENLEKQQKTR